MKYLMRFYRLGEGRRRETDSILLVEKEWDANEDFAADIAEQAGPVIEEAARCDVAKEQA